VMGWSLGKMIRTHLKPRSFSSRSHGNLTEDVNRFEFGVIETPRFIELYASYGCGPALRPVGVRDIYRTHGPIGSMLIEATRSA
jgi:hypothetical protein